MSVLWAAAVKGLGCEEKDGGTLARNWRVKRFFSGSQRLSLTPKAYDDTNKFSYSPPAGSLAKVGVGGSNPLARSTSFNLKEIESL